MIEGITQITTRFFFFSVEILLPLQFVMFRLFLVVPTGVDDFN